MAKTKTNKQNKDKILAHEGRTLTETHAMKLFITILILDKDSSRDTRNRGSQTIMYR